MIARRTLIVAGRAVGEADLADVHRTTREVLDHVSGRAKDAPAMKIPAELGWMWPSRTSGPGFRVYSPDGALAFSLAAAWMRDVAQDQLGGDEIITPSFWSDKAESSLGELIQHFRDRVFLTSAGSRRLFARYGADPGFYEYVSALSRAPVGYPLRVWEFGTFHRRNQTGELRGDERLHEFHLLDHHTLTSSPEEAWKEYFRLLRVQIQTWSKIMHEAVVHITATQDIAESIIRQCAGLSTELCTNFIIDVDNNRRNYWGLKSFVYVPGPFRTANLQFDDTNGKRFNLGTPDNPPFIIHCTLSSVERVLLALSTWNPATRLPTWISPVQVRVIPIGNPTGALSVVQSLREESIRAEMEDRPGELSKHLVRAAQDRIPHVVLIGPKEIEGSFITLRLPGGVSARSTLSDLVAEIALCLESFPRRGLSRCRTSEAYWRS